MKITKTSRETQLPYQMIEAFDRIKTLARAGDCEGAYIAATRYKTALEVGIQISKREGMHLTPLSTEAKEARKPLRPHELLDALQGTVHIEPGKCRGVKTARNRDENNS